MWITRYAVRLKLTAGFSLVFTLTAKVYGNLTGTASAFISFLSLCEKIWKPAERLCLEIVGTGWSSVRELEIVTLTISMGTGGRKWQQ